MMCTCDFDLVVVDDENVLQFQIAMHDQVGVKILEPFNQNAKPSSCLILRELSFLADVIECITVRGELKNQNDFALLFFFFA
jgi:hypothetical protein